MRILVTGGAGYLGAVMVPELLNAGHQVSVLDNLMYGQTSLLPVATHQGFNFHRGDARDEQSLRELVPKADVVIPLAAIVGAPACERDPLLAESLNLEAIRTLVKLRSPDQMVIFPTTNSGYGTKSGELYCTEESPLEPISVYGRTKVQAEEALLDAGNAVTLRLATVFGVSPRQRTDLLVNHFVYEAIHRGFLLIYEGDFKRNFIHIRDVADCFLYALEHFEDMRDETYNVGLDEANYSKRELADLIKEQVPDLVVTHSETGHDPDKRNYMVSNAKLRRRGFEARRGVSQGIDELTKAYAMLPDSRAFANA